GAKKALLQFDLAPVATLSPAQVDRAVLVLWVDAQTNPQEMTLKAYPVTVAWDAATANWMEAAAGMPWTLPGASAAPDDYLTLPMASAPLQVGRWAVLDVTDIVKGWLGGTLPNHGLLLTGESPGAVRYSLGGSLHTQAGARPALLVESHP
ncbi:MAG: DNRLRE domain-containing protein, partial [Anaerolineae bacterium]|nr:DNRLRE domain-containing protein [Anaerolineae bacterium]